MWGSLPGPSVVSVFEEPDHGVRRRRGRLPHKELVSRATGTGDLVSARRLAFSQPDVAVVAYGPHVR